MEVKHAFVARFYNEEVRRRAGHAIYSRQLLKQQLRGGKLNRTQRNLIETRRKECKISVAELEATLALLDWSIAEFEAGVQTRHHAISTYE